LRAACDPTLKHSYFPYCWDLFRAVGGRVARPRSPDAPALAARAGASGERGRATHWRNALAQFSLGRKRLLDTLLAATYRQAGVQSLLTTNPADFGVFGVFSCITPTTVAATP